MYHDSPQGKYFTICIMQYRNGTGRILYNALFRNSQAHSVKSCEILREHVEELRSDIPFWECCYHTLFMIIMKC